MAGKKYPMPNLENATPSGLVDMLAKEREKEAEAKFYAGIYRTALLARLSEGQTTIEGEDYVVEITTTSSERFDITTCRFEAERGDPQAIEALKRWLKPGSSTVVSTKERVKMPAPVVK